MNRRFVFAIIAFSLAAAGLVLGGVFMLRMPRTYTIAVGPAGLETHRYAEALARLSSEARDRVRYRVITTMGAQESARLLEERKADLAIVRSDYDLPANGQTLLVNTKRVVVAFAPRLRRGGIQTFADLKGKRIAVVRLTDPNLPLVRRLLAVAEIGDNDATLIEADLGEIGDLFAANRIDAAIAVTVPNSPQTADAIPLIARRLPNGIRILPIPAAEAMASRIIGVETQDLPAGIFGAGRPEEEVSTVAISYRTMARSTMPNDTAADIAKSLYDQRTRMARIAPVVFTAEPPDAKTGARIPAHPGAVAYFDGESRTFMERWGESLLMLLWGGTLIGSVVTGFFAWVFRKGHDEGGKLLDEVIALTAAARAATPSGLAPIESRIDEIVGELARKRAKGWTSDAVIESASLALDHFRSIADAARGR
jgi:TRAP transporter TAXI family solute receptor